MNLKTQFNKNLHFGEIIGPLCFFSDIPAYEWLDQIPRHKKTWISLWEHWGTNYDLPPGYDAYILSWHNEAVNLERLRQQAAKSTAPIYALSDGNHYDHHINGVEFVRYTYWHHVCNKIVSWYPKPLEFQHQPQHKYSAICNRASQSKIWIITKLLETARADSIIKLGTWIENKNVHGWEPTNNHTLDGLTSIFRQLYLDTCIEIDDFNNASDNNQKCTSNPWQNYVQDSVINFTNESFHYSFMLDTNGVSYIHPGPFLTEKTWKCLVGGRPIISVGQFDVYQCLTALGLDFSYAFDLTFDRDPGNISRFSKLIDLIDHLNTMSIEDLQAACRSSAQHNREYIVKGAFHTRCQQVNYAAINYLLDIIS